MCVTCFFTEAIKFILVYVATAGRHIPISYEFCIVSDHESITARIACCMLHGGRVVNFYIVGRPCSAIWRYDSLHRPQLVSGNSTFVCCTKNNRDCTSQLRTLPQIYHQFATVSCVWYDRCAVCWCHGYVAQMFCYLERYGDSLTSIPCGAPFDSTRWTLINCDSYTFKWSFGHGIGCDDPPGQ